MKARWVPHLLGLVTPGVTLLGLYLGGWWMGGTLFLLLVVYPIVELLLGQSSVTEPLQEGRAHSTIAHLHALCVPVVLAMLFWRLSIQGLDETMLLGILSAGLSNGASGIVAAHELGHRRPKSLSWWTARLSLFSVLYLHFTTEHNHTHHKHWARDVDPTSSPWGRSIYGHLLQTIPRQVKGAYLARPIDTRNVLVLQGIWVVVLAVIGWPYLLACILQAAVAVYLLEFVNYIQHHGLRRGEQERAHAAHAWESRHRLSRWTLLELPLHPSHHLKSSTPFHRLDVHEDAPKLPLGYYGMFWLALMPPLFSKMMQVQHARLQS
jgi:alkane 1-monooxygenase